MFLLSLMLVIVSAWSLATFLRLSRASKKYKNNKVFESACQLSKAYVTTGTWMGVSITVLSLTVLALTSYSAYKGYSY